MDSSQTCWDYLSMEDSHPRQTIFSWEIMSIEASSHWRQLFCCLHTKSSIRKISSYWGGTTNVVRSTECMGSMTNVRDAIALGFGRNSKMCSTACQLLPWSTTRFFACTEDSLQNSSPWPNFSKSQDPLKCLRMAYSVICFGLTLRKLRAAGVKMIEESATRSARPWLNSFWRRMT